MKTSVITLIMLLMLGTAFSQSKKELKFQEKKAEFEAIKPLLDSKDFSFTAEYVNSTLVGTRSLLTQPNTVEIRNDSVFCDLPFFGTAYHVDYGDRGGLQFELPLAKWKMKENQKKMSYTLTFEAKKANDWFKFTLEVFGGGSSTLTISSQNRQSISYWGNTDKTESKN